MTCLLWETCPYYLRCDSVPEMTECGQVRDCEWYRPEKDDSKNNNNFKKGQMNYEVV